MLIVLPHAPIESALMEPAESWTARLRPVAVVALVWIAALGYGAYRIHQVDAENATAPALRAGIVQENLGLMEKSATTPRMAIERHLAATRRLEQQGVDLVVWSESAVAFFIPERIRNIHQVFPDWDVHVPVLFGALSIHDHRMYNTAFVVDANGAVLGTYDKTYLLAFGEYLPGGEMFPKFYEWSPHSGHFTPGSRLEALPLPGTNGKTVTTLICYEDILPRFVRHFQHEAHGSLLAVILNDAWFGNTPEPWMHLVLSKFRSVELRRDFVRSANSGVSGFIDAAGRVITHTGVFSRETSVATVHLRTRHTL